MSPQSWDFTAPPMRDFRLALLALVLVVAPSAVAADATLTFGRSVISRSYGRE
ncbi:MAG TPA: hypothetical protein VGL55_17035 [Steroidobacteraceae bacterium]|jgi:hypothetical protein